MRKAIVLFVFVSLVIGVLLSKNEAVRSAFLPRNDTATVIVDAGHGGVDGGAVGISGVYEKDLNLEISEKLCCLLRFCGVETVMTRSEDESIHKEDAKTIRAKKVSDIKSRVEFIEGFSSARLISIHLNHFSQASCFGAQVFYSENPSSIVFAKTVQERLKAIDNKNKRVVQKAGDNIYLLKNITCPAILVECGFLSNPLEEEKLREEIYQKKLALCIASGYLDAENEL